MAFEPAESAGVTGAESTPLEPRPSRGFGSIPFIIVGLAVAAFGWWLTVRTAPCSDFHWGTQFSGSQRRLWRWIGGCGTDVGQGRRSLAADAVLIAGYAFAGSNLLRRWWPLCEAPPLKRHQRTVIALPVITGALDLLENALTAWSLGANDERMTYPSDVRPALISALAWAKWLTAGVAFMCIVGIGLLAISRALERRRRVTGPVLADIPDDVPPLGSGGLGVCCSGGGIRAAAFSLGALEQLETAAWMTRAKWLTAVSGGNYAATSWTLAKAADPSRPAANDIIDWLRRRIPGTRSKQHRFLVNGPGGLGWAIICTLGCIAVNLFVLGTLVAALAWPVGRLLGTRAIQPRFHALRGLPREVTITSEHWAPGVVFIVAGLAVLVFSSLPFTKTSWMWRVAALLAAVGVALLTLIVWFPMAMAFVGSWMNADDSGRRPTVIGVGAIAGALGMLWRLGRRPIVDRVRARLPQLGGLLLVFAGLVWGGKVATDAAVGAGRFRSEWVWFGMIVAFIAAYLFVGTTQLTIHRLYRRRLTNSFGLRRHADGELHSPRRAVDHLQWSELPETGPQLVVCCAQQRNGIAPGGLPADTFTISRTAVRMGDAVASTPSYLARLPADLRTENAVASWMATSGAAFASAMGRLSKGSTNALMAALNIDLGIWLPNPRLTSKRDVGFSTVRFDYLFKEILGWYDQDDRFVFVADGGHWDNLGLVELLRRRCDTIVCLDASGDAVGRFTTLRQSVELASLELPNVVGSIEMGTLTDLVGVDGGLPRAAVALFKVNYLPPDGSPPGTPAPPPGMILYAKAQLAEDLDIGLRRFAKADPRFPHYSTAHLFLSDDQYDKLVELGRAAGKRVSEMLSTMASAPEEAAAPPAADLGIVFDAKDAIVATVPPVAVKSSAG